MGDREQWFTCVQHPCSVHEVEKDLLEAVKGVFLEHAGLKLEDYVS